MERQEIEDELFTAGVQELLDSTSAAHLTYTAKDGTPRVIPVGSSASASSLPVWRPGTS